MLIVRRDVIGATAFARLQRAGLIHDIVGGLALPADVLATRSLRLHMVSPFVPGHAWLTGLAALWVEGHAPAPLTVDLAVARGAHRTASPPGSPRLAFHSGWLCGLPDAGSPRLAGVARACLDALCHSGASSALPAVASALRAGATTIGELLDGVREIERHTPYRARVASLVGAFESLAAG